MVEQNNASNQSQGNKKKEMKERRPGSRHIVLLLLEIDVAVRKGAIQRNGAKRSIRRSRTGNAQRSPFGSAVEQCPFIVVADLYVVRHCVDRSFFAGASLLAIATKKFCTQTLLSNSVVSLLKTLFRDKMKAYLLSTLMIVNGYLDRDTVLFTFLRYRYFSVLGVTTNPRLFVTSFVRLKDMKVPTTKSEGERKNENPSKLDFEVSYRISSLKDRNECPQVLH